MIHQNPQPTTSPPQDPSCHHCTIREREREREVRGMRYKENEERKGVTHKKGSDRESQSKRGKTR